jgi:hypothetical protein
MATNGRSRYLAPAYKQYSVIDDVHGFVLDVEATTTTLDEFKTSA